MFQVQQCIGSASILYSYNHIRRSLMTEQKQIRRFRVLSHIHMHILDSKQVDTRIVRGHSQSRIFCPTLLVALG